MTALSYRGHLIVHNRALTFRGLQITSTLKDQEGPIISTQASVRKVGGLHQHLSGGLMLAGGMFLAVHFLIRLALFAKVFGEVDTTPVTLIGTFAEGTFYDVVTASYLLAPMALYLLIFPLRWFSRPWHRRLAGFGFFCALYFCLFGAVAEWLFWDEFGARFNFIAVDYLIYTTEVLGNIRESYSLPLILGSLLAISVILFGGMWGLTFLPKWLQEGATIQNTRWTRLAKLSPFFIAPVLFTIFIEGPQGHGFRNSYNQELAQNGIYSFFAAFRNNELNYDQFYDTQKLEQVFPRVKKLLAEPGATFVSTNLTDITRKIVHPGPEKQWNVIQITVESLSAEYMAFHGSVKGLTPRLDALAQESLFFTNFYATGTRTVRGMEALTLSLPPTPGQSIVRRPGNENLFSLGSIFRERGYDTAFIYGGYGYFDNMNYFFGENGYRIIDRRVAAATNITFANVWGACDEDVLNWSLKEADEAFAHQRPFHHFVMTTSNHRPYTYPEGRIDIPSHSGREGGVKYTDYAIGKFIDAARSKLWFTNTVFVIVADHCASSAGRTDLPIERYEIPLIIYNPGLVQKRMEGRLCSQIDYAPTLLGLMNWSYQSKFFGNDILSMGREDERAFIASYQKLGILNTNQLAVMKPVRAHAVYNYSANRESQSEVLGDDKLWTDGMAYYQAASYIFRNGLYGALHGP